MILETMLQRLYASLVSGPSMNARPHRSRQRCDFMDLAALQGLAPENALRTLLEQRKLEFPARVASFEAPRFPEAEWSDEQKKVRDDWNAQSRLLKKLRDIAEDARDYLNDHGESCLAIGFPLLSVPPQGEEKNMRSSRVLAPLLLMPVELQVRTGSRPGITLQIVGEGADMLIPNPSLLAWIERQTGKTLEEVFADETAVDPWREVAELLAGISGLLSLEPTAVFSAESLLQSVPALEGLPKGTQVIPSAVLGLFPLSNQSLLRDTRWMLENQPTLQEPVSAFLNPQALQTAPEETESAEQEATVSTSVRNFPAEWLVANADPCQANAVLASREAKALVVHGPPGTGKSQTIMNMIADHLARGERILFVCDKRTALDVVKYRLDAAGLGRLCGVVHDPSGDRRDFYMGLREHLENLADSPVPEDPKKALESVNKQLGDIHRELDGYRKKLQLPTQEGGKSFHDMLGEWMARAGETGLPEIAPSPALTLAELDDSRTTLEEICRRAERVHYRSQPFQHLLGITLQEYLLLPAQVIQERLAALAVSGASADAARPGTDTTLHATTPFAEQAQQREQLATKLEALAGSPHLGLVRQTAAYPPARITALSTELKEADAWRQEIKANGLDRTLLAGARGAGLLNLATVNQHLTALQAWEPIAWSFFKRLFAGQAKAQATAAVSPLGLALQTGWQEALAFYRAVKTRLLLAELLSRVEGTASTVLPDDEELESKCAAVQTGWLVLQELPTAGRAGQFPEEPAQTAEELRAESCWAKQLEDLMGKAREAAWFSPEALTKLQARWAGGESTGGLTQAWQQQAATMEEVVRLETAVRGLPVSLQVPANALAEQETPAPVLFTLLERMALENGLRERLHADPELAAIDGDRIEAAFTLYQELSGKKQQLVRDFIKHHWTTHQRRQLLAMTGSQLNRQGTALRSRLYVRGKKALKLRQMLATGQETEGGDPLYDLCPVWMASPSTVAQIFPRQAIFDVVIFDEASQCRLEEALPVLLRGHRVVIAGDQKQLPPTRFFEQTLSDTSDTEAETAEELFYQQQSEAVDLLSAALNLEVREAYLDVHYRSRNEDLIGFSNEHYYGSRLQPIPGHPQNKARETAIRVHRVDGVYEQRANPKEAEAAAALVAELLTGQNPPSIGLACFNLTQRDAILDALATLADKDADFARRLETARQRKGRDSFEGLFVKNLENVQGDERDVMIICTTFGPDAKGKFRRNFGALSQRDGGRRLNVLVTRARDAVHVLTSIPTTEYTAQEEVPPGHVPNGRLQLYAYLRYADRLAVFFEQYQNHLEEMRRDAQPERKVWPNASPSPLALALGVSLLKQHRIGNEVHWGNDGFCVDVACTHPIFPADVTVGVLTDFSRFHKTPDPIEWDLFRTSVLRGQGWELERLWSPVLFRRREEMMTRVQKAHEASAKPEKEETEKEQPATE